MKNSKKISIPNPCSENWDAMQPNDSGRFCNACEKTVIDFTKMSDEDFVAYFQHIKPFSCGRFSERQLDIQIPKKSSPLLPFWKMNKYVAASMIAAAGLSGKVFGQKVETAQIEMNSNNSEKNTTGEKNTLTIFRGRVLDKNDIEIPYALIVIQNTNIQLNCDENGMFELKIPQDLIKNDQCINLLVGAMGYESEIVSINLNYHPSGISIFRLQEEIRSTWMGMVEEPSRWGNFKSWLKTNFF
jgi:hypothetical protein